MRSISSLPFAIVAEGGERKEEKTDNKLLNCTTSLIGTCSVRPSSVATSTIVPVSAAQRLIGEMRTRSSPDRVKIVWGFSRIVKTTSAVCM